MSQAGLGLNRLVIGRQNRLCACWNVWFVGFQTVAEAHVENVGFNLNQFGRNARHLDSCFSPRLKGLLPEPPQLNFHASAIWK